MRVDRYETIIVAVDMQKNKMLSLKFIKINNDLYCYNYFLPEENRKIIQVLKINDVDVSTFINKIEIDSLYSIDEMKKIGIDTTDNFICTLVDDGNLIDFDIISPDSNDAIFFRQHEVNKKINTDSINQPTQTLAQENVMLDYASTNAKSLLTLIKNMCTSEKDKQTFGNLLDQFSIVDDKYTNVKNNLDIIFLSTQLLIMEDKIKRYISEIDTKEVFIPQKIERLMERCLVFDFGDESLNNSNNAILTNNEVDYKKILIMIRNCIAHSNYKVIDNDFLEFYNETEDKMNFKIRKKEVISLFEHLYQYYYLDGKFPLMVSNNYIDIHERFNEETLLEYLNDVELFQCGELVLKRFASKEKQASMDDDLSSDLDDFIKISTIDKSAMLRAFSNYVEPHLQTKEKEPKKLNDEDIKYILINIKDMGEEYFYNLGKTAQNDVIKQLIYKKYNKDYYYMENIKTMISSDNFNNSDLNEKSSDYIRCKTKIELLILSFLNNLLLFCYNNNKSALQISNIRFPNHVYVDYQVSEYKLNIDKKIKKFYEVSKIAKTYQDAYLKMISNKTNIPSNASYVKYLEECIRDSKITLQQEGSNIEELSKTMNSIKANQTPVALNFDKANIDILGRIRDSLAHGRLKIEVQDLSNIVETKLHIEDIYYGKEMFKSTISLKDLINSISNNEFLESLLGDNQNFNKHFI